MINVRRTAGAAVAAALTVTAMTGPASAATPRAELGADWLSGQLSNGLVVNKQYDFTDYGLTVDVGNALVQLGSHPGKVRQITKALKAGAASYTTGVDFGRSEVYANATAKLAAYALRVGADPRDFGGRNLVKQLSRRVATDGAVSGRIQDKATDDYANVIGQAVAVEALAGTGSDLAGAATSYLLQQQCAAGYFRLGFADPAAADQTCDGAAEADRAPDTDVTALAVLSLSRLDSPGPKVRASLHDAKRWLKRQQADNGSFGGGPSTAAPNANSTGLAAWALGELGACPAARDAAQWVKGLQVPSGTSGPLAKHEGAVALNRAALKAAREDGITKLTSDQWRRASAQAVPGLAHLTGC